MADDADRDDDGDTAGGDHRSGHRRRLRDRFLKGGNDALHDYELLELMLFMAQPRRDMKPVAKALLDRFGGFAEVITADPETLRRVPGVGDAAVAALKTAEAASIRLTREQVDKRPVINSWDRLLDYCRTVLAHGRTERFHVLFLDQKNRLIADERQQEGTVDHTPLYPREVVKRALDHGACALILVHNHPSGDLKPSRADVEMTRKVQEAARPLGVTVHDHVVVGRTGHTSFKASGLL